jgi:glycosyltransferase involved in cell wall biosynthesis
MRANDSLPVACYLTWGEVTITSGIFRNLIIPQLLGMAEKKKWRIIVVSGIPMFNITFLFHRRRWRKEMDTVRDLLEKKGIQLITRRLFVPSFWFSTPALLIPLLHFRHLHFLARTVRENRIRVLNCRSYHATLLASLARRAFGLHARVVFDTRGAFPEECVMRHSFARASLSFLVWKRIERKLFGTADLIVNISEEFSSYVRKLSPRARCITIHASTDLRAFEMQPARDRTRSRLCIPPSAKVLAYIGNLSAHGYHSLELVAGVFQALSAAVRAETHLLIVSQSPRDYIRATLAHSGVDLGKVHLHASNSIYESAELLSCADYGVFPFQQSLSRIAGVMAKTMIGSKIAEYLAAGLPVIANCLASGVRRLVVTNGVGIIFDPAQLHRLAAELSMVDLDLEAYGVRCREAARRIFDVHGSSASYVEAFEGLVKSNDP